MNLEHTKKVWPGLARVRGTPRARVSVFSATSAVHLAATAGVAAPHPALSVYDHVQRDVHSLCPIRYSMKQIIILTLVLLSE